MAEGLPPQTRLTAPKPFGDQRGKHAAPELCRSLSHRIALALACGHLLLTNRESFLF